MYWEKVIGIFPFFPFRGRFSLRCGSQAEVYVTDFFARIPARKCMALFLLPAYPISLLRLSPASYPQDGRVTGAQSVRPQNSGLSQAIP